MSEVCMGPHPRFVVPETYCIGATAVDRDELVRYLEDTDQMAFLEMVTGAIEMGMDLAEVLCSLYAKLCYAALTTEKNENVSRIREIADNVKATLAAGHGSVFEHVQLNFITTNCSRVFTHELVRHRVGTAFSQTSGRYVRVKNFKFVFDPILEPARAIIEDCLDDIEQYYKMAEERMLEGVTDFGEKKKITSALRRILPNGQSNEMGWSANIRSLRHLIMMRTSRHAEWEIRKVFSDIYQKVGERYKHLFADGTAEEINGALEVTGMVTQPY